MAGSLRILEEIFTVFADDFLMNMIALNNIAIPKKSWLQTQGCIVTEMKGFVDGDHFSSTENFENLLRMNLRLLVYRKGLSQRKLRSTFKQVQPTHSLILNLFHFWKDQRMYLESQLG